MNEAEYINEICALRARLAAVLALCDEWNGGPWGEAIGVSALLSELEAAARGEGDQ